jgi:hypothetical protein
MAVTVQEEQNAFEQQVPELLAEHQGQFVLFKEGRRLNFLRTIALHMRPASIDLAWTKSFL